MKSYSWITLMSYQKKENVIQNKVILIFFETTIIKI